MDGQINDNYEAVISLLVRGPTGQERFVQAVLDTGFNAYVTLPASLITDLALPFHGMATAELADGRRVALRKYQATAIWDGKNRPILVLEADGCPLLGMAMLRGHRMTADILVGGGVTIERLQPTQ